MSGFLINPYRFSPFAPTVEMLEIASFSLGISTDRASSSDDPEVISWDIIRHQSGFSPALTTNVTTVAVPAGATKCFAVFSTKSPNNEDGYADWFIYGDAGIKLRNSTHGSDFLTHIVCGWFDCSALSTIDVRLQTPKTGDDVDASSTYFGGRFFS